jgi:capsule polysaccharide modification protein KpsS
MSKTFHDINDTIFEAYMIMLVLGTNFNRYIIHAGAAHIDYLENWFKSTLEYNEYFQAKLINDQTVDISGLVFL